MDLKKVGAISILSVMVTGLFAFIPPIYKASSQIFNLGSQFAGTTSLISSHSALLNNHQAQISQGRSEIREFRSVWCMDRLSSSGRVNSMVLEACAKWIKSP